MAAVLVYMTAGDRAEAVRIGRVLVEERLAACANVLDGMTSIYRWQGEVCEDGEAVLIAKTTEAQADALTERVKALHSYDCPCVVSLAVEDGNPDYLDWLAEEIA